MGVSRRFQNLIVDSPFVGATWLRCVELTQQLFNCHQPEATRMEKIQISNPSFRFQDIGMRALYPLHCFPLSGGRVVISDHTGRTFFCDANGRNLVTMPSLHKQKRDPISLFVPSADADDLPSGSLYIMERIPGPEKVGSMQPSDQFEVLVCRKPNKTYENPWHCQALLPPPYVRDPAFTYQTIAAYALVGSNICMSTLHNNTYFLDTASNKWTEDSKVVLPFYGKVEYAPELKLWFGLTAQNGQFAAADLSTMDSQPELVGDWTDFDPPTGWLEADYPQLVTLGSGKFCITRFFATRSTDSDAIVDRIAVFTGVEVMLVMHDGNCSGSEDGQVRLRMKRHKSRFHVSNETTVTAIF